MTIKDLCQILVENGECKRFEPIKIGKETYCNYLPSKCDICDKAIKKYWLKEQK